MSKETEVARQLTSFIVLWSLDSAVSAAADRAVGFLMKDQSGGFRWHLSRAAAVSTRTPGLPAGDATACILSSCDSLELWCSRLLPWQDLNDHQRSAFYESLGLNTTQFNQHVIIESQQDHGADLPCRAGRWSTPTSSERMDRLVEHNNKVGHQGCLAAVAPAANPWHAGAGLSNALPFSRQQHCCWGVIQVHVC